MNSFSFTKFTRNGRLSAAAAGLAFVIGGIVASFPMSNLLGGESTAAPDHAGIGQGGRFGKVADAPGCGEGGRGIALVGRLAPGHTLGELPQGSVRAVDGAEDDLVVFWPGFNPFSLDDLQDLPTHPALPTVGWLRSNTVDPALRSCDYRLEDNSAAAEIGRTGSSFMVQAGLLTQHQIDGPGTTFQLAEDPTNPAHLFFTVVLASGAGGPGTALSDQLFPYTATIDRVSGAV